MDVMYILYCIHSEQILFWAHFGWGLTCCHTQLTPMSPQMFSHRNWNHSWSKRQLWFTHQTFPCLTTSNPKPFNVTGRVCQTVSRKRERREERGIIRWERSRDRQLQTAVKWLAFHIGEKPPCWMPPELSKRCDQVCVSIVGFGANLIWVLRGCLGKPPPGQSTWH